MSNARNLANVASRSADLKAGTTAFFAMSSAPSGWLKANGAAISRTAYADLYAAVGTTFGTGDGSTTFNVPDMRGEFPRGWDDSRGIDSGRALGQWQYGSAILGNNDSDGMVSARDVDQAGQRAVFGYDQPFSHFPSVRAVAGGGTNINVGADCVGMARPRNIALLACIKF